MTDTNDVQMPDLDRSDDKNDEVKELNVGKYLKYSLSPSNAEIIARSLLRSKVLVCCHFLGELKQLLPSDCS